MEYRKLGRTGLEVSTVCMGCWASIGDDTWGPQDEADSAAAIEAALDAGVTFFDTAEGYGRGQSEELLGGFPAVLLQQADCESAPGTVTVPVPTEGCGWIE